MADQSYHAADDSYEAQNDAVTGDAPSGTINDDSYVRTGDNVQRDDTPIDDPVQAPYSNSDEQLARDDKEAIDESNIIDDRTRGAKPTGSYSEGPDEDDLPAEVNETGSSALVT